MLSYTEPTIQQIKADWLEKAQVELLVRREDENHVLVSGNKWWKLKYNLEEARRLGFTKLLTFGGAYSNHIYATAAAARDFEFESIGVIRGEKTPPLNSTLQFAENKGMHLHYVSREEYKRKSETAWIETLSKDFGKFYLIPEGGTNNQAVRGCAEWGKKILEEMRFDYLCLPVGTGGTLAGLIESLAGKAELVGFSALKEGTFLNKEVSKLLTDYSGRLFSNWSISTEYAFGGYAKTNKTLDDFIRDFQDDHGVPLEPVYTGKMMYGICDLISKGFFDKGSTILALHTGGLQSLKMTKDQCGYNPIISIN